MEKIKHFYLEPGNCIFSDELQIIHTILGSCLSIVFYDKASKYYAISHCLLPTRLRNKVIEDEDPFHYVDSTIEIICHKFNENKFQKDNVIIKIFGGSTININKENYEKSVGFQNYQLARDILKSSGYNIHRQDVGGDFGRKVIFSPKSGHVYVKRLIREE